MNSVTVLGVPGSDFYMKCYTSKNIDEKGNYIVSNKYSNCCITGTLPDGYEIYGSWYESTLVISYADVNNYPLNGYQEFIEYIYERGARNSIRKWWRIGNYSQGWGAWTQF